MEQPRLIKTIAGYLGKIFVCAFTFTAGLIASRIILNSLGIAMARFPQQAEEAVAGYYLVSGSLILTLGLFPLYGKIAGSFSTRFLIVFSFLFVCFGIAVTWESSIYSVVEGSHLMILVLLLPTLLFSLIYSSCSIGSEFFISAGHHPNNHCVDWQTDSIGPVLRVGAFRHGIFL